ncbi:MAG: hypothetical protein P8178_16090 [Candidatus Thiodiazotropha sp.]
MTLFFVLGGLLFLALMLASIAQRYQAYVEERRRRVQRILRRVGELEETLLRMSGLPVPVEAERILRSEVLARLELVKKVHPRYRGIDAMIAAAAKALDEVKPVEVGRLLDHVRLESLLRSLGEVLWMVQERRYISPLTEASPRQLMQVIALRRAECVYRHHRHEAERMAKDGQMHQALWHCRQILAFINEHGPEDDQVSDWYREAQSRARQIERVIRGQPDVSSSE